MESYPIPASNQQFDLEIKRSRFITSVGHVQDKPQAKQFIAGIRAEFPDANHHCWAIVAGQPDDIYQQDQSDDGEPRGTAGRPMLNVLQHSGLGNTAVVVTRYFGGIKLGTGGLVRAYTQSVSEALIGLKTDRTYIKDELKIEMPYAGLDRFEHWLQQTNTTITHKEFLQSIILTVETPKSEFNQLKDMLHKINGKIISR